MRSGFGRWVETVFRNDRAAEEKGANRFNLQR
jgi:hypothetical protein